jgi:ABC-2 type transport system permease protein
MKQFIWLLKRQLKSYFVSPFFYILMGLFFLVCGFNFTQLMRESVSAPLRAGDILFASIYLWLMVVVVISLLTMPLIAEEKRSRTIESLLATPVTEEQIIYSKYFAALIVFVLIVAGMVVYPLIMGIYSDSNGLPDLKQVATGFLILILLASAYIAIGLMVSSFTKNQGVAAALSFTILGMIFFFDVFQLVFKAGPEGDLLNYLSAIQHIADFANGIVDSRVLVLYPTAAVLFLFIAVKALRLRMWR